jgi:2-methylcitrate dehydratase PrpD
VETIRLSVHLYVLAATGKPEPRTALEGKFSVSYCAAIGMIEGAAGPGQLADDKVRRPDAVALRRKVKLEVNEALRRRETVAELRTTDGRTLRERVEHASGAEQNPMSDADPEAKFHNLTSPILGAERADQLADLVAAGPGGRRAGAGPGDRSAVGDAGVADCRPSGWRVPRLGPGGHRTPVEGQPGKRPHPVR